MGNLVNTFASTVFSEADSNKVAIYNAALQILDDAIAGILALSTTGGTTTLTGTAAAPQAQHMFLSITGTLGSNAIIQIPVSITTGRNRVFMVKNATTGAFSVTVRAVGGTGVTVGQGHTVWLLYNGTDIQYASASVFSATGLLATASASIGARAFHSTTQSIPNSTVTTIALDSERFDTDVIHDNSTNNSRLTCKTAGAYLIAACLGYAANGTGSRQTILKLNGTTNIAAMTTSGLAAAASRHSVSTIYQLAVNDYVEIVAFQDSGGALLTEQNANIDPEFSMIRLGV